MKPLAVIFLSFAAYAAPTCNAGWPSTSIPVTISGRFVYQGNSYRSGSSVTLDGTGSSGTGGLSYLWTQVPNLTTGITSAIVNGLPSTSATPTINVHVPPGQTAAPLDISLQVTDGTGSTTCYISDGVVATGDDGTVIVPAAVATILGNSIQYQKDPWPFRDSATADVLTTFFGTYDLAQTGSPVTYSTAAGIANGWNTASTHGTITSITSYTPGTCPVSDFGQGCFKLVGSAGTQFDVDFCGGSGGTNLSGNPYMLIWYNTGLGTTGRMMITNGHCAGAGTFYGILGDGPENQSVGYWPGDASGWTGITIAASSAQTNLQYSAFYTSGTSTGGTGWFFTSQSPYYDPGAMFYALYYRSGIDIPLWCARAWVDAAWTGPWLDRGQTLAWGNQPGCVNAENCYGLDFGGFLLRSMDTSDGHPDMWEGLQHLYYWAASYLHQYTVVQDARIAGTAAMTVAYGALLDQSSGGYATTWCPWCSTNFPGLSSMSWPQFLRTEIHSSISTLWSPGEDSVQHGWLGFNGYYPGGGGGFTSYDSGQAWSGKLATITTTGGTSTVTCTGCTWSSAMFSNKFEVSITGNPSTTPCSSGTTCVHIPVIFGPSGRTNSGSGDWDNQAYCQTGCSWDGTTLTLDRTYAGANGSYNWAFPVDNTGAPSSGTPYVMVAGWGQDSFMGGLLIAGFLLSAQACAGTPAGCSAGDDTTYNGYATDETNWILNYTQTANTYGMSYFGGYPVSIAGQTPPVSVSATNYWSLCTADEAVINREILGDSSVGMIRSFIKNPTSQLRTYLDNWFAGMWGKSGVGSPPIPSPDGLWDVQFDADRSTGCTINVSFPFITGCPNAWYITDVGLSGHITWYGSQKGSAQHFGISIEDNWPTHRTLGVPIATRPSTVQ